MKTMLMILLTTMLIGCGDDDPISTKLDEGEKCSTNDECHTGRCSVAYGACLSKDSNRPVGAACRFDWDCNTLRCSGTVCADLLPTGSACDVNANYCSSGHCVQVMPDTWICS